MTTVVHFPASPKLLAVNIQMELTHQIQTPNLLERAVILLPPPLPARTRAYVHKPDSVCVCVSVHVRCQGSHKDFEYNLVWSAALEAIFCSFSTAVLEIANQGVLAAV